MVNKSTTIPSNRHGALSFFALIFARNDRQKPIIPQRNIIKNALIVVIGIMTFLGGLAIGAVQCINKTAQNWENQLIKEATIQIQPIEGLDTQERLNAAAHLVKNFPSVRQAQIITEEETAKLLKPWLGDHIDFKRLPIPRLIIVQFYKNTTPDYATISKTITETIKGARFNNHEIFSQNINNIVHITNFIVSIILLLVFIALSLTLVFATRAALSTNAPIIEVLHFIGTDSAYIARQFDIHFFKIACKGAISGSLATSILFYIFSLWNEKLQSTIEGRQMIALLGNFQFSWYNYLAIFLLMLFVSILTMVTSHFTVLKRLEKIDNGQVNLF